jgi:uncharacterized protein YjiS (DUF1127 family)
MLTLFLRRLAAAIGRALARPGRAHGRHTLNAMLMFDDHLLRDIGLTRTDVIECLSSPADDDPVDFLDARRKRNATADCPAGRRLAA